MAKKLSSTTRGRKRVRALFNKLDKQIKEMYDEYQAEGYTSSDIWKKPDMAKLHKRRQALVYRLTVRHKRRGKRRSNVLKPYSKK